MFNIFILELFIKPIYSRYHDLLPHASEFEHVERHTYPIQERYDYPYMNF